MFITEIKRTKAGRYSLFINGEFAFSVTSDQLLNDQLVRGMELDEEKYDKLFEESGRYFARDRAIALLSKRSYTRYQLFEKLKDLSSPKIINEICDRMEEIGLVDDKDYGVRRASDLYHLKNFGQYRVYQDLLGRGIERELAHDISVSLEPENKVEIITSIIEKKHYRRFEQIEDRKSYYKCVSSIQNSLVRMGHGFDDIKEAIDRYLLNNEIEKY